MTVGGQYLNNTSGAFVSGSGIEAKVGEYARPMTRKEFNDARDKLRELQQAAGETVDLRDDEAVGPRPTEAGDERFGLAGLDPVCEQSAQSAAGAMQVAGWCSSGGFPPGSVNAGRRVHDGVRSIGC